MPAAVNPRYTKGRLFKLARGEPHWELLGVERAAELQKALSGG